MPPKKKPCPEEDKDAFTHVIIGLQTDPSDIGWDKHFFHMAWRDIAGLVDPKRNVIDFHWSWNLRKRKWYLGLDEELGSKKLRLDTRYGLFIKVQRGNQTDLVQLGKRE